MTWWKRLEPTYKALTAILGAIALGMGAMAYTIGERTEINAAGLDTVRAIMGEMQEVDAQTVGTLEAIQSDVELVRCWARAEIEDTDARRCLFDGGQ